MLFVQLDEVVDLAADRALRIDLVQHEVPFFDTNVEQIALADPEKSPKLSRHDNPTELVDAPRGSDGPHRGYPHHTPCDRRARRSGSGELVLMEHIPRNSR